MDRERMISKAAGELVVGLDGAASYIHDWLKTHDEPLQPLCKQVATQAGIPESWDALRGRVRRMQAEATTEAESERTTTLPVRRLKSALKNAEPEQIAEVIESLSAEGVEKIADALVEVAPVAAAKAAIKSENKSRDAADAEQRNRAPELVKRFGFADAVGDGLKAKIAWAKSLEKAFDLDLDDEEREALLEMVEGVASITGWYRSFLTSGTRSFDEELALLLDEAR